MLKTLATSQMLAIVARKMSNFYVIFSVLSVVFSLISQEESEKVFVIIYCIEAATKIIASGFVLHKDAYLRNGWNILDFVVVVVG